MSVTLTINDSAPQALAFLEYAKTLDFVQIKKKRVSVKTEKKKLSAEEEKKLIEELTKSTNKAITKRMFAYFDMPYPEEK